MNDHKKAYSLRLHEEIGNKVKKLADENRRTVSAEMGLLIEQGMAWREEKQNAIQAQK